MAAGAVFGRTPRTAWRSWPGGAGLGDSRGLETLGVTVLQANATMDAGPVWASEEFVMRTARKNWIAGR